MNNKNMSTQLLTFRSSDVYPSAHLEHRLDRPIILDKDYEYSIGLTSISCYNTIQNINQTRNNNAFQYSDGTTTYDILLPNGSYEVEDIQAFLYDHIHKTFPDLNIKDELPIEFIANHVLNKVQIAIYSVGWSLTLSTNFGKILGFDETQLEITETTTANSKAKMNLGITSFYVTCNLISSSVNNSSTSSNVLSDFMLSVAKSSLNVHKPDLLLPFPLSVVEYIDNIVIRIVDQDGNLIDFNNEPVVATLYLQRHKIL